MFRLSCWGDSSCDSVEGPVTMETDQLFVMTLVLLLLFGQREWSQWLTAWGPWSGQRSVQHRRHHPDWTLTLASSTRRLLAGDLLPSSTECCPCRWHSYCYLIYRCGWKTAVHRKSQTGYMADAGVNNGAVSLGWRFYRTGRIQTRFNLNTTARQDVFLEDK